MLERIEVACRRAGRDPSEVELLAVTKHVSPRVAAGLVRLGQRSLAENRATELERKTRALESQGLHPDWHFIGTLQRNKVRRVLPLAGTLHSVDSLRLLDTVERVAGELGRRPRVHLQINVSAEDEKHGFEPEAAAEAVEAARACAHVELTGLMGMAPRMADASDEERRAGALASFRRLAALAAELPGDAFAGGAPRLSMGMSGDLEEAVLAGSHVVRVGSALFEGVDDAEATA